MSHARIPFLPTFLTILSIAFAVVLVARIRSYSGASGGRNDGGDVASASGGASAKARRSSSSPDDLAADDGSAQTSTIVTLDSKGNPQGLSARERQYRELLNAPPPKGTGGATPQQQAAPVHVVAAARPPEKPQSTLQKIMQP